MKRIVTVATVVVTAFLGSVTGSFGADDGAADIAEALTEGTPSVNLRLRYEHAEVGALDDGDAFTIRTRLGYGTKPFKSMSLFVEFEDVTALNDTDNYSQAGLNADGAGKSVIADVEGTELNQLYLSGTCPLTGMTGKFGRQRLALDNHRFVGNVGWRQNEQTMDAYTLTYKAVEGLSLFYGYVDNVYRIFGQENGSTPTGAAGTAAKFESDSHLLNASYKPIPEIGVTVYGYLLGLGGGAVGAANSADTFGLNIGGNLEVSEVDFAYGVAYANQSDNDDTTAGADYSTSYLALSLSGTCKKQYTLGAGYEVLGSDSGVGFSTPLATLHKFNGWSDAFLVTPAMGLRDAYARVGLRGSGDLSKLSGSLVYHDFSSDIGDDDYGTEVDLVAKYKVSDKYSVLAKYAGFEADGGSDVTRFWVQADLAF